jgi:hypothetical protein
MIPMSGGHLYFSHFHSLLKLYSNVIIYQQQEEDSNSRSGNSMCHPGCVIKSAFEKRKKKDDEKGKKIHTVVTVCVGAILGSQVQQPTPPQPAAIYCIVVPNK